MLGTKPVNILLSAMCVYANSESYIILRSVYLGNFTSCQVATVIYPPTSQTCVEVCSLNLTQTALIETTNYQII